MLEDYYFGDLLRIALFEDIFLDLLMKFLFEDNSLVVKKGFHTYRMQTL